jgi:hypothetical protein
MPMMRWACLLAVSRASSSRRLDQVGGFDARLVLDDADQLVAGLLGGEAGDLLEPRPFLLDHLLELDLPLLHAFFAAGQRAVELMEVLLALGELVPLFVEVVFLLRQPPLERFELGAPLAGHRLELGAGLEKLLLGGNIGLAQAGLALPLGVLDDPFGVELRLCKPARPLFPEAEPPDERNDDRGHHNDHGQNKNFIAHQMPPALREQWGGPGGSGKAPLTRREIKASPTRPCGP